MSESDIAVGDLVVIVPMPCCGNVDELTGHMGFVTETDTSLSLWSGGVACSRCEHDFGVVRLARISGLDPWFGRMELKKLRPPGVATDTKAGELVGA